MLRSAATVLGSYVLSVLLVLLSDSLLSRLFPGEFVTGRIPSNSALAASTALFVVISILCAWLCARYAPGRAARHVLWFGVIGEVLGVIMTIPNWTGGWPHWYFLALLVAWPVSCYLGLLLSGSRSRREPFPQPDPTR
jgi:hypothetical protein